MNILIVHSASKPLIQNVKNTIDKRTNETNNFFIITFKKNKGMFLDIGKEIYFTEDDIRINAFKVKRQLKHILKDYKIDFLVGASGDLEGQYHLNIKVLFSFFNKIKKDIYNKEMEIIDYRVNKFDKLVEFYLSYEYRLLPKMTNFLCFLRKFNKRKIDRKHNKKIMIIYDMYAMGGIMTLIYEWGKKLSQYYDVICVCENNGEMYQIIMDSPIRAYLHNENVYKRESDHNFLGYLNKILKTENPDIAIILGIQDITVSTIACTINGVPKIIKMLNGVTQSIQNCRPIGSQLINFSKIYDNILSVSKSVKYNLIDLGLDKKKIDVIYGSTVSITKLDSNFYDEINGKIKILCLSRLSKEKGVDIFIKAISQLEDEVLDKCEFLIAGNGEEEECLNQLAINLGISNKVKFLGYISDAKRLIEEAYLTVLSSHTEGLPLVVLESMARRKICIASNVGGVSEIINDKVNGLLFEDNDYEKLGNCITYCVENVNEVKRMEDEAFKTINKRFDINIVVGELIKLIE